MRILDYAQVKPAFCRQIAPHPDGFFYFDGPDRFEGRVPFSDRVASIRKWVKCIGVLAGRFLAAHKQVDAAFAVG